MFLPARRQAYAPDWKMVALEYASCKG